MLRDRLSHDSTEILCGTTSEMKPLTRKWAVSIADACDGPDRLDIGLSMTVDFRRAAVGSEAAIPGSGGLTIAAFEHFAEAIRSSDRKLGRGRMRAGVIALADVFARPRHGC
jgi:hypothetical protein